jgi:protein-S-isoprenylcysteine O-methyltransferase Ste14
MPIKITVNNDEIKNPLARVLLSLLGIVLLLLVVIVVFFIVLPLMWFALLSIIVFLTAIFLSIPRIISIHKIYQLENNKEQLPPE